MGRLSVSRTRLISAALTAALLSLSPATAQELGGGGFQILGAGLDISPEAQAVPIGIPTLVHTVLPVPAGVSLPEGLAVRGELSGPGISGSISLVTFPNGDFQIPAQGVKGGYALTDIRLTQGNEVLGYAAHRTAVIAVTDVLVTQVTSRPLTYQEMVDKGIVVSQADFSGYAFTFAMTLDSKTVTFEVPIVFSPSGLPVLPTIPTQSGTPPGAEFFRPPQIRMVDLAGPAGLPKGASENDAASPVHIPTLLLIPGDVAFLNQFFSVSVMVQNGAPAGSNLVLQNVTATARFPGQLQVKSANPPVNLGDPVPIHDPGPDGILGTADDVTFLVGQAKGNADFVVEGLRSGTFEVPIDVNATVTGLPAGPLALSATTSGSVIVRHPSFFVALDHPDTIREGEAYTITAAVTNTSGTAANQVSLAIDQNALSGAQLLSDPVVALGEIAPNDTSLATFQMKALRTGRVQGTAVFSDGSLSGAISLEAGIGELGVPISPDTLILPKETSEFDPALMTPARQLVGLAWSLAKSPAGTTDPSLPAIGEQAVRWRVSDLGLAARHERIGEPSEIAFAEWVLGWLNANPASRSNNFDLLRRMSSKGAALEAAGGTRLSAILQNSTPADFEAALGAAIPEEPHVAAVLTRDADPASAAARLSLVDPVSGAESTLTAGEDGYARGLANAAILPVVDAAGGADYGWVGAATAESLRVRVVGIRQGTFDLFVSAPASDGSSVRLTFTGVSISPGQVYSLDLPMGGRPSGALLLAPGTSPIAPAVDVLPSTGLAILAAAQDLDVNPLGKAVSVLFNRSLDAESSTVRSASNYTISASADDPVDVVAPQAADPRLVVLGVRDHPSPYRKWTLEVHSLRDALGIPLAPDPQTLPVAITDTSPGGTVTGQVIGADAKPVPDAEVVLRENETSDITGQVFLSDFAVAEADAKGQFTFDYVPLRQGQVFGLEAADPATGYQGTAFGQILGENQTVHVNVVLLGRGDVVGTVRDTAGNPLAGAYVTAASVFFPGEEGQGSTNSAADGTFAFKSFPVGPVQLWAFYQGEAAVKTAYQSAYIPAPGATAQQDIVVDIQPSASVSGTVVHERDGSPAVGLYVVVYGEAVAVPWYPYSQRKYFGFVVTGPDGRFSFPTVSPGNDEIQVFDPARGWAIVVDRTISVVPDQQLSLALVELDAQTHTGSVQGHVYVNRNGAVSPDPNAFVWMANSGLQVATDAQGAYTLQGLPVGNQSFQAYDQTLKLGAGRSTAVQDGVAATLDFTISIDTQASGLKGSVVDPLGNPVPGASVAYFDQTGAVARGVVADSLGQFSFDTIAPGGYRLFAYGTDLSSGTSEPDVGFADVTATAGNISNVVIALAGYGTVQGHVMSSHFDDDGQAVSSPLGAHLALTTGRLVTQGNFGRIAWPGDPAYPGAVETDSDPATGAYSFRFVLPGTFAITVHSPILGDQSASAAVSHSGQIVTEDFRFQGTSSIDGFLYDEKGAPLGGAAVDLYSGASGTLPGGPPLATVMTAADAADPHGPGYFRFAAVPAGDKTIAFHSAADGKERFAVAYASVPGSPVAIRVALHAGRVQDVRVAVLEPVSGALQPVSGASVSISESDWPRRSFRATTESDGTATFPGISEGPYAVRAQSVIHTGAAGGCVCDEGGISQVSIALSGSGSVHGMVLFPGGGAPVSDAQVLVYGSGLTGAAQTDSAGNYRVDGLPLGTALSLLVRDNSSARSGFSPSFVLASDGDDHESNVTLIALGFVDGTFLDAAATAPIAGATVTLFSSSELGNYTFRSGTDGSGAFTFGGVPQGIFTLNAAAGVLSASGGGAIEAEGQIVDVALRAEPVGSIAVHVVDASGAELSAQSPPPIVTISGRGDTRAAAATSVQFDTIPVGVSYAVSAEEQASPPHHRAVGSVNVPSAGVVAPVTLQYVPYGRVAVHVVRTAPDDSTSPIASGQVRLASSGLYGYQFPFGASVSVDAGGSADFVDVGGGPLTAFYTDPATGASGSASGVITADGQQVDLTVSIGSTATVEGHVFQPNPNSAVPASGATVVISGSNGPTRAAATDASGAFHFDGVPYGGYQLTIDDGAVPGKLRTGFTVSVAVLVGNALDVGNLVLDGTAPSVLSSNPASGASGLARRPSIELTFSEPVNALKDLYAGSPTSSVPGSISIASDRLSGTWVPYFDLGPGETYLLSVPAGSLEDLNGWPIAPFSTSFSTLDNVGPAVVGTSPSPGTKFVSPKATVTIAFDQTIDPASVGAGSVTLKEIFPSSLPVDASVSVPNGSTVVLTPTVPAINAAALFQVTVSGVRDMAGNAMSQPYSFQFWTTDNTPPAVSFQNAPSSVLALHTYSFTVAFRSSDGAISSADVASLAIESNDVPVTSFGQAVGDSSRTFSYRIDRSLANSALRLKAVATDFSGNQSVAELDLPVLPDQPPTGSMSLSAASPVQAGQPVTASVSASDDIGLQFAIVRVSGLSAGSCSVPVSNGHASGSCTFAIPVTAAAGGNVDFTLDLSDGYQEVQTVAASLAVARDAIPPGLGPVGPPDGTTIASGSNVTLSATATDDLGIAKVVFAAGIASAVDTTTPYAWTFRAPVVAAPTDLPVTVTAEDYGGNLAARTLTYHVTPDAPPSGRIALAPAGPVLPGRTLTATVSATDDFGLTRVSASGSGAIAGTQAAAVSGTSASPSFSFTVPLTAAAGASIVVASDVTDSVGQVTHALASTTVAADVEPPVIVSTSPADGSAFISGDAVALSAQVTDNVAVKSVDFVIDGAVTTIAAPPFATTWVAKAVTAATTVSVRVVARDLAGNSAETDSSFRITPLNNVGAPAVKFVCPTDGAMFPAGYTAAISVSAADDQAVSKVEFFVGSSSVPFASLTNGNAGIYAANYTIPADAGDGSSIALRVRAYDFANNIGETSTAFTVVAGDVFAANATITNGSTNHDGHTIIVTAGTLTIIGHHAFNGLVVLSGAVVSQTPTTPAATNALDVDLGARGLYVACGGAIDVSAKGYAGGVNTSAGKSFSGVSASGTWSGGSHGGRGGDNSPNGATPSGADFGSVFEPFESGGGGGSGSGVYAGNRGGNGGGAIRIVAGSVRLDGMVVADGEPGNASGGAGGSVRISAVTLSGSGTIRAQGGASAPGILPNQIKGEAGAGGRIAIDGDLSAFDRTHVLARGGVPVAGRNSGGAGTIVIRAPNQTFGDLLVDNGTAVASARTELVGAGRGIVGSIAPGAGGVGIAFSDANASKVFPFGVVGEFVQISRAGAVVGSWRIVGYGSAANALVLESGADVRAGDAYSGAYSFDSVSVSGKGYLESADPISTGAIDIDTGSTIEDPSRNSPPAGSFTPAPAPSIAAGKTLSVTIAASDDFALSSIRLISSGAVTFDQTKSAAGKSASATFSIAIPGAASGSASLTAVITDDLGAPTTLDPISVSVYQDAPPAATVALDPPDQTPALGSVTATAGMSDDYGLASMTFHVSGATALTQTFALSGISAVRSTSFTIPVTASGGGSVSVFATVVDSYGHTTTSATVVLPVTPDRIPPRVFIDQPTGGTEVPGGNNFTVSGSDSDDVQVKTLAVAFNGQSIPLTPSASFSKTFTAPNVAGPTSYPVAVTATDYANNMGQATVTVVVRPPKPPQVTITCPSGEPLGVAGFPIKFNFSVAADKGFSRFEAYVGGATSPATTSFSNFGNGTYSTSVPIPTSALSGDAPAVELRVYDSTGAAGSAFATVHVVGGDVLTADSAIGEADASHDGNLVIVARGNLTVDGHHDFAGLVVLDGATVTQLASTAAKPGSVDLSLGAGGLFVACSGAIDVSSVGYPAQTTYPGGFSRFQFAPHGGLGSDGSTTILDAFGSTFAPSEAGAGGSGPGGGRVIIDAPIGAIDGRISADGQSLFAGTGAGGSIWLDVGTLRGVGSISAAGGSNVFGGSGGGRIALYGDLSAFSLSGVSAGSITAPGTVLWKSPSDRYGNLKASIFGFQPKQTVLVAAGAGIVGSVGGDGNGTTITDATGRTFLHGVVGEFLRISRGDAVVGEWQVVSQSVDGSALVLDPAAAVEPADDYQGIYRFDTITLSGAKLFCSDPVIPGALTLSNGGRLADPVHDHAPVVTMTTSPAGRVTPGETLSVTVAASDDHRVSTVSLVAGGAVTYSQSTSSFFSPQTYVIPVPPSTETGSVIHLVATAVDDDGFSTSSSADILVGPDTVPPVILFTSPAEGSTVMAGREIAVNAAVTDDTALAFASLVVDGRPGSCVSTGGAAWSCGFDAIADPVSVPRPILATVTAVDRQENSATASLHLTIVPSDDAEPPSIAFVCPAAMSPVAPGVRLGVETSAADDRGIYRVDYFLGDALTPFDSGTGGGRGTLTVPPDAVPGDVLTVRAVAYDYALNVSSATLALSVVDADVVSSDTLLDASDASHEGRMVIVSGSTLTVDGHHRFGGLAAYGSVITQIDPTATSVGGIDLDVESGMYLSCDSSIDVAAKGYPGGFSGDNDSAKGLGPAGVRASDASAGGTHAGIGGVDPGFPSISGDVIGSLFSPAENGGGGGGFVDPGSGDSRPGGNGGGVVLISSSGPVVLDGQVSAWGGDVQGAFGMAGAGAGGAVSIRAPLIGGNGWIDVSGGWGSSNGAGGGGGRIALAAEQLTLPAASLWAGGGSSSAGESVGAGTILVRNGNEAFGDLIIDNGGGPGSTPLEAVGTGTVTGTGSILVDGTACPTFADSVRLFPADLSLHAVIFDADAMNAYSILSNDSHGIVLFPDPALVPFAAVPGDAYQGVLRLDSLTVKGGAAVTTGDLLAIPVDAITVETSSGSWLAAKNFP